MFSNWVNAIVCMWRPEIAFQMHSEEMWWRRKKWRNLILKSNWRNCFWNSSVALAVFVVMCDELRRRIIDQRAKTCIMSAKKEMKLGFMRSKLWVCWWNREAFLPQSAISATIGPHSREKQHPNQKNSTFFCFELDLPVFVKPESFIRCYLLAERPLKWFLYTRSLCNCINRNLIRA